jgi:serine/threonine protein kinase
MVIKPGFLDRAEDIENYHREVYLEAYIQTVLQSDTTFGRNVATIQNMYRDEGVTRYRSNHTYYYKMERIPYTIDNILQRAGRTAEDNLNLITNLANILEYFDRMYSFRHRDLHANNILFAEDGSIKIIDFGLSCIIKDGINYAVSNTSCASYDILILITCILEYNMMNNIEVQLNQLLSDREVNLFTELSRRDRLPALFHMVYQFQIDHRSVYPWSDRAMRHRLITNIAEAKLRPDRLVEAWTQVRRNRAVGMAGDVPENNNVNVKCDPFNPFSWCFRKRKTRGGKRRNRKRRTLRK